MALSRTILAVFMAGMATGGAMVWLAPLSPAPGAERQPTRRSGSVPDSAVAPSPPPDPPAAPSPPQPAGERPPSHGDWLGDHMAHAPRFWAELADQTTDPAMAQRIRALAQQVPAGPDGRGAPMDQMALYLCEAKSLGTAMQAAGQSTAPLAQELPPLFR